MRSTEVLIVLVVTLGVTTGCGGPGPVSVKAFGAKGDGSSDDTAAIQAAIAAVKTAGAGTVVFPRGTYRVAFPDGAPAFTTLFALPSNTRVWFRDGARIRVAPVSGDGITTGVNCSVFGVDQTALPVTNVELIDIDIQQTTPNPPEGSFGVYGVFLGLAEDAWDAHNPDQITSVRIVKPRLDALASGIYIVQRSAAPPRPPATWADSRQVRDVAIVDAVITNATGSGITADGKEIVITNATISAVDDPALTWDAISIHSGLGIRVVGGTFSGFSGGGNAMTIRNNRNSVCGTRDVVVEGVTFRGNAPLNGAVVYISSAGSAGSGEDTFGVSEVSIRRCTFLDGGLPLTVAYGAGPVVPFRSIAFDANEVIGTTGGPAFAGSATHPIDRISVSDNTVYVAVDGGASPVLYATYVVSATIVGNTIVLPGPSAEQATVVLDNLEGSTVMGNTLSPQGTAAF